MSPNFPATHANDHDDFGGLQRDSRALSRRGLLGLAGGVGATLILAACGDSNSSTNTTAGDVALDTTPATSTSAASAASAGAVIPDETQGPYPADGSNGPNVLADGAVVRRDITTSFGDLSGSAAGVPARINLTVVDAATGSPVPNAAVYLWHCTADGRYSIYEVSDQNYLRGIQVAENAGLVTFDTIFPGCYRGRWPHCHFEVFDSIDVANAGSNARKISQLALPEAACAGVYESADYGDSASNLGNLSLTSDNVFADGWTEQLATVDDSAASGLTINLLVRV